MAKIYFGLAGEGRGHATRAMTIINELKDEHKIVVYAPADAHDLLHPIFKKTSVKIRKHRGLHLHYTKRNNLNWPKTLWNAFRYTLRFPRLKKSMFKKLSKAKPDLVITDFDPAIARAAQEAGIRYISIDHQHFLTCYDLTSLPLDLQYRAKVMAGGVNLYYTGQYETVVSAFFFPPIKPHLKNVSQIGVLLRKEVLELEPTNRDHIVAYLRKFTYKNVFEALEELDEQIFLYGLGEKDRRGNITFCKTDANNFIAHVASAKCLISTAGNQVVGEALYLGKPVFAMPEKNNYEQEINGHFLQQSNSGISVTMDKVTGEDIRDFLNKLDYYRNNIDREKLSGNKDAIAIINKHLAEVEKNSKGE
jgi:uncharacterized protein (TIGR00661 family)